MKIKFNANKWEPAKPIGAVPAGDYLVRIVKSEVIPTKEQGKVTKIQVAVRAQIEQGEFAGQLIFDRMLIKHPNETAVEIGSKRLSSLCHACDKISINETEVLHGIPVVAQVTLRPSEGKYPESNDVRCYIKSSDSAVAVEKEPWDEEDVPEEQTPELLDEIDPEPAPPKKAAAKKAPAKKEEPKVETEAEADDDMDIDDWLNDV